MSLFDLFGRSPFAEPLPFLGAPEPPLSLPLRLLSLADRPLSADEVRAAFRRRLREVHPDVDAYAAAPELRSAVEAAAIQRPEVAEVVWARNVLLAAIPVTGSGVGVADVDRRNAGPKCRGCGKPGLALAGDYRRAAPWRVGYCKWCVGAAEAAHRREVRRAARAGRVCAGCGESFTPARSDARYCSPACRQRAYRVRAGS